jgi:FtsZ-binding cell division protein ZapB
MSQEDNLILLNKKKQQEIEFLKKDIQTKKYQSKYLRTEIKELKCDNRNLQNENKYYQKLIDSLKNFNQEDFNHFNDIIIDDLEIKNCNYIIENYKKIN